MVPEVFLIGRCLSRARLRKEEGLSPLKYNFTLSLSLSLTRIRRRPQNFLCPLMIPECTEDMVSLLPPLISPGDTQTNLPSRQPSKKLCRRQLRSIALPAVPLRMLVPTTATIAAVVMATATITTLATPATATTPTVIFGWLSTSAVRCLTFARLDRADTGTQTSSKSSATGTLTSELVTVGCVQIKRSSANGSERIFGAAIRSIRTARDFPRVAGPSSATVATLSAGDPLRMIWI